MSEPLFQLVATDIGLVALGVWLMMVHQIIKHTRKQKLGFAWLHVFSRAVLMWYFPDAFNMMVLCLSLTIPLVTHLKD